MSDTTSRRSGILVVEDEQVVAMDLEQNLMQLGYEVKGVAAVGSEAVRMAGDTCPDLVLMDIQLQGEMDGIAAADEIRQRWQIPVVFITANANEEILRRAKAVGPLGYLTKPFRAKDLKATIAVALEQRHLTEELFAEQKWLATMLASLSDGVIATDMRGIIRYLNPVAEELTGWSSREAIGKPIEEIYSVRTLNGQPLEKCQLRRVLGAGESVERAPFLMVTRYGRQVAIEDAAAPIEDAHGTMTGAVSVFLDITERQRAEQERERLMCELQRSNEDLARFSYAVSHDLQAPLRNIRSLTELLAMRVEKLGANETEISGKILHAAEGMQRLIESLLEYAQAGQRQMTREPVSIPSVIETVLEVLRPLLEESQGRVVCEHLPTVQGDPIQLEQLFQNLLSNAIKYRRAEETLLITVSSRQIAGGWEFAVEDNGQGIPPESKDQIFEPSKRLHGSKIPGTGLGLALCRTIVERYGGRIWVEAADAGQGAVFRFTLCEAESGGRS